MVFILYIYRFRDICIRSWKHSRRCSAQRL